MLLAGRTREGIRLDEPKDRSNMLDEHWREVVVLVASDILVEVFTTVEALPLS